MDTNIFWFILSAAMFVAEFMIVGFYTLVISVAALAAAITGLFTDSLLVQVIVFSITGVVGLIYIRPFLQKKFRVNETVKRSGVDALIGEHATVKIAITPEQKGRIRLKHEDWAAASANGESFAAGDEVVVERIEGVTAIVSKVINGGGKK